MVKTAEKEESRRKTLGWAIIIAICLIAKAKVSDHSAGAALFNRYLRRFSTDIHNLLHEKTFSLHPDLASASDFARILA